MEVIKACIYANEKGHYMPVAYMAERAEFDGVSELGNGNKIPRSMGVRIVPMGIYSPIKGIVEKMSLTAFERLLENCGFKFLCTIDCYGMKRASEVYDAFRMMLKGAEKLRVKDESESESRYEPCINVDAVTVEQIRTVAELVKKELYPDWHFGDTECNVWSIIKEAANYVSDRNAAIEKANGNYFVINDRILTATEMVNSYFETGCFRNMPIEYMASTLNAKIIPESEMDPKMLYKAGKKVAAIKLYKAKNNCSLLEAKNAVEVEALCN